MVRHSEISDSELRNKIRRKEIRLSGNSKLKIYGVLTEAGFAPSLMSLQNVGVLAKPVNQRLQAALERENTPNKFYIRSVLINTGVMTYDELYSKDD